MSEPATATRVGGDGLLVERARTGDERALDALVSRHHAAVYQATYRVLGDPDRAADAAQDTFVKALAALGSFRGEASFRTWLLRIATNTARSAGRKTTRRREVMLDPEAGWEADTPGPERQTVMRSEAARVDAVIAELPEKQRLAVTLRLQQELSYREIAEVIGSTEGTVRVNYHLGIKRVRERLT
jgi:RNA polymerase sigma-70 factor (ECF subfamily)